MTKWPTPHAGWAISLCAGHTFVPGTRSSEKDHQGSPGDSRPPATQAMRGYPGGL
jgi:hypothetical protein